MASSFVSHATLIHDIEETTACAVAFLDVMNVGAGAHHTDGVKLRGLNKESSAQLSVILADAEFQFGIACGSHATNLLCVSAEDERHRFVGDVFGVRPRDVVLVVYASGARGLWWRNFHPENILGPSGRLFGLLTDNLLRGLFVVRGKYSGAIDLHRRQEAFGMLERWQKYAKSHTTLDSAIETVGIEKRTGVAFLLAQCSKDIQGAAAAAGITDAAATHAGHRSASTMLLVLYSKRAGACAAVTCSCASVRCHCHIAAPELVRIHSLKYSVRPRQRAGAAVWSACE